MIELEQAVTFAQAARKLPRFGNGKPPHVSTIWRWATIGVRGHRLEVLRLGRRYVTSMAALERFSAALAQVELPERPARPNHESVSHSTARRDRAVDDARERLRKAGI